MSREIDDDIVARVRAVGLDVDDIYAFVVWDLSTDIDVTEAVRERLIQAATSANTADRNSCQTRGPRSADYLSIRTYLKKRQAP